MSETDGVSDDFVVTPPAGDGDGNDGGAGPGTVGGTALGASARERMRSGHTANLDDPLVEMPPRRPGARPEQQFYSAPGRLAIVQGQVYIVGVIMIFQLWLITAALWELLSGNIVVLWPMAIASFVGFMVALLVFFWPRRRAKGY